MGWERALQAIYLRPVDRIPSLEVLDHPEFIEREAQFDPYDRPAEALAQVYKKLDIDMCIHLPRKATRLRKGETIWDEDGSHAQAAWGLTATEAQLKYPFTTIEEVLDFDPLTNPLAREQGLRYSTLNQYHEDLLLLDKKVFLPGWYYTTLFMFPVMVFGWEMFMLAAATQPARFRVVLDKFAELSIEFMEMWADTGVEVIIAHDDLASSAGPIFNPDWYRKYIFPWYDRITAPFRRQGKKVIFCSDGDITALLGDLAKHFDGFLIEPLVDLEYLGKTYGQSKVIIGGIDTKVLTFGAPSDVEREVRIKTEIFRNCPGYFYMAAGSLPGNIPIQNLDTYFASCRKYGTKEVPLM